MEEEGDDGAGVHEAVRVLARLAGDAEEHVRAQARGLPLVLHELFPAAHDAAFWGRVRALLEEEGGGDARRATLLDVVRLWLSGGRPLPKPLKIEIKMQLSRLPDSPALQDSLREVDEAIEDYSPVLGRWKADNSPRDNMLFFMSRTPQQIAAALTAMCLPFFRLRAWEFSEKNPGPHLKDLNDRYKSVSSFVALSILCAASSGKKAGIAAYERWLDTAHELHFMRNYHMLFALQNAFATHPVDRLTSLSNGISKKHKAVKTTINELFSTEDRMRLFLRELALFKGREPLIPCVFWLYQKATLLNETPLYLEDGHLNLGRINAAQNIFSDVQAMQRKRYPPLREEEQILWYLLRLERANFCTEDDLYLLSDAAKKEPRRFSLGFVPDPKKDNLTSLEDFLNAAKK